MARTGLPRLCVSLLAFAHPSNALPQLYGLFMTLYIIFSIIFGVFLWRNREFSHPFQVMIMALLIVSWIYLGVGFIIYMNINSRGRISTGVLVVESVRTIVA